MSIHRGFTAVLACLGVTLGSASARCDTSVVSFQLRNGLRVYLEEDHRRPRVAIAVSYGAGLRDEPPGYHGLAHLVEHLMFRGSRHMDSADVFPTLQRAGITWVNAHTTPEGAVFEDEAPMRSYGTALWFESDRMAFLLDALTPDVIEKEREVVRNEWQERGGDSLWTRRDVFVSAALFPEGHPYHSMGNEADIDDLALPDVQWFFQTHYCPDNATVALVGDFVPRKAEALIRRYFEGVECAAHPVKRPIAAPVALSGERRAVVRDALRNEGLVIAWPIPKDGDPGATELNMLAQCLGSSLRQRLVIYGPEGLAVLVERRPLMSQSLFVLDVAANTDADLAAIQRIVDEQIALLRRDATSSCPIDALHDRMRTAALVLLDHFQQRATYLAEHQRPLQEQLDRAASVSAADLTRAAQTYLVPERRLVLELRWQSSRGITFHVRHE